MEIPVYLFTGFLEAGKTKFIQETLEDPRFTDGTSTLVLVCEEGETGYNVLSYPAGGVHIEYISEESELTDKTLAALVRRHKAKRVLIEYNGMWSAMSLFYAMPRDWVLYQEMCFIDCTTFDMYNKNMRSLVVDKFTTADLVVFNRYYDKYDRMELHKAVRGCSRGAQIVYEYPNGEAIQDDIEDPLPFDRDADSFTVEDKDYALFYRDMSEDMEVYEGKTVTFKAYMLSAKGLASNELAAGRQIMTCCAEDIAYSALVCCFDGQMPAEKSWADITAKITIGDHKAYGKSGPILHCIKWSEADKPEDEVATFY